MRIFFLWSLSVKPNLDNDITPSKPRVPWHLVSLPEFSNDWRMEGTARWLRLVLVEITYTLLVMFPSSGGKPLDNHDGMITHVCRARLLDCKEVKWALGSITTNKANGDDGIPAELFQILKDDAVKVLHSIQFSSVHSLGRVRLCNPMDCSMPGLPVHHKLPELTQTHVHWVSDAIHPSHPLLSPSPPALSLSQQQGLFHWVSSHQVAKVLELQLQHQLHTICSKSGKLSRGHRTGKGQFSFQSKRKSMPKNIQTTTNCTHLTC